MPATSAVSGKTAMSTTTETAVAPRDGVALVLANADATATQLVDALVARLTGQGWQVVRAVPGREFAHAEPGVYQLRADRVEDIAALLVALGDRGPVMRVFHLGGLGPRIAPGTGDDAYFGLLALLQALEGAPASHGAEARPVVAVVADGLGDVSGCEALAPGKATLLGLAKVAGQEYPGLDCRVIDAPRVASAAAAVALAAALAAALVDEADRGRDFLVALRGAQRWVRRYRPVPADLPRHERLRRGGTYLITGGMGAVGLALARYLAGTWGARLVLLGRTPLPPRSDWPALAEAADQPATLRRTLRQLLDLEAAGAEVMTVVADVLVAAELQAALARAHARFGPVHGVVHAVVHPGRGLIGRRARADVEAAWASKIAGTDCVLRAVAGEPLDFVMLCSSVAALIGGLSRSDYAAANAGMDALAAARRRETGLPVVSVNWDAWRDVGVAVDLDLPGGVGLDEAGGVRAFERILLGPDLPQVVVSTTPLEARLGPLDQGLLAALEELPATTAATAVGQPRPVLPTPYVAPDGVLQEGLSAIWTEMLGIAPLGVDDSLFDLGGDSLLAIRLLSRVRKVYGVELHPADFFRAPTIARQADEIERRLLDEIEQTDPLGLTPDADGAMSGSPDSLSVAT
ncbi:hypothetical protein CDN99_10925 [Roseateles aquatilis]|uniref:Carrier domain-containing protein n=2 Tax=Roseateles aquatilis TaxID=431061 RepID=A0A246JEL0_9BURK|nr:hypothetical protein CDN99_10925 [Roseateles aquatilis]